MLMRTITFSSSDSFNIINLSVNLKVEKVIPDKQERFIILKLSTLEVLSGKKKRLSKARFSLTLFS